MRIMSRNRNGLVISALALGRSLTARKRNRAALNYA